MESAGPLAAGGVAGPARQRAARSGSARARLGARGAPGLEGKEGAGGGGWGGGRVAEASPGAPQGVGVSPGESGRDSSLTAHPLCLGSQELVREMVDADVELMRNNPNA